MTAKEKTDSPPPDKLEIAITVYPDGSLFVASQVQDPDVVEVIFGAALQALKDRDKFTGAVFH